MNYSTLDWLSHEEKERACKKSYPKALSLLGALLLAYGATIYACLAVGGLLAVPLSILAGFWIAILFVVGHDACHNAYVKHGWANQFIGRLTLFLPLHNYSLWVLYHNRHHHGFVNMRNYDPSWNPLTLEEYQQLNPAKQFLYRAYRSLWGSGVYYIVEMWIKLLLVPVNVRQIKPALKPVKEHWYNALFVLLSVPLQIILFVQIGQWINPSLTILETLLIAWVIPFLSWNWLMGITTLLQHTHPKAPWYDNRKQWKFHQAAIEGTTHANFPVIQPLLLNISEHTAHHFIPSIPLYNIRPAEKNLLQAYPAMVQNIKNGFVGYYDAIQKCKLYDFNRHCWTDFNGNPTGPILRDSTPEANEILKTQAA